MKQVTRVGGGESKGLLRGIEELSCIHSVNVYVSWNMAR